MLPNDINWADVPENEGGARRIEPGGYVVCVLGVRDVTDNSGSYLDVDFDVAEGPYKGYYAELNAKYPGETWKGHIRLYYQYKSKRNGETVTDYGRVKAWKTALEKSNGIQIHRVDEKLFKDLAEQRKIFGVLMGYDQREHKYLNAMQTRSADVIRAGDYQIPDEWKIRYDTKQSGGFGDYGSSGYGGGYAGRQSTSAASEIADDDPELPF